MDSGYVMIDCGGLELTSQTVQVIDGLYQRCKAAYKSSKTCYAHNCLWEEVPVTPIPVFLVKRSSGNYIAMASTLQVEVDATDGVTITNMLAQ